MGSSLSELLVVLMVIGWTTERVSGQGVHLMLHGVNYPNNSNILITDIGEGDSALLCVTDNTQCCRGEDNPNGDGLGQWYFPNNTAVGTQNYYYSHTDFFYRNRGPSIVRLNRRGNPTSPTGLYRCEVPDSSGVNQTVYVNIVAIKVQITSSGINTAGQQFNLTCIATVEGSTDTPTITWLDGNSMTVPSGGGDTRMVSTVMSSGSTHTSILQFDPLQSLHAETYTCQVSVLAGTVIEMRSTYVIVFSSSISVMVSGGTPTAGQSYFLTCSVSGADQLNPIITYQWFKTNPETQLGTKSSFLFFTSLRLSDAGLYRCDVTVSSTYLSDDITAMSDTEDLRIMIPTPVVTISSPDTIFVGSSPTLNCSIELSEAVDIEVTVNTVWSGPSGTQLTTTTPAVLMSGTTYTGTATLSSVETSDSGVYTCRATVSSQTSSFVTASNEGSGMEIITIVDRLQFIFRGAVYPNGSYILLSEINTTNRLICITTRTDCCTSSSNGIGEFHFPNGNLVPTRDMVRYNRMYRERGDQQIRLGRVPTSEITGGTSNVYGLYWCDIPDSSGNSQRIYINIVETLPPEYIPPPRVVTVAPITSSGTNIAGQQFSLTCTATAEGPTITWLDGNSMTVPSGGGDTRMVSTMMSSGSNHTSILTYDPLQSSHAGTYTCQVSVGTVTEMRSTHVTVVVPPPTVMVDVPSGTLYAGTPITLTCTITVDDAVDTDVEVNVTWTPSSDRLNIQTTTGSRPSFTSTVTVSPLSSADTGFTCRAVVRPPSGSSFITASGPGMDTGEVTVQEIFVKIVSSIPVIFGQSYSLTCTVSGADQLNPIITYQWFKTNPETQVGTNSSTLSFTPLRLSDVRQYRCDVTVSSDYLSEDIEQTSNTQDVIIPSVLIQLRMSGLSSCHEWALTDTSVKINEVINTLVTAVEMECQCGFTKHQITEFAFKCFPGSETHVTFRARLTNTSQATTPQLISHVEQWLLSTKTISVQMFLLGLNTTCGLLITDLGDPECPETTQHNVTVTQTNEIFQLKFGSTEHCIIWNSDKAEQVQSDIHKAILQALTSRCQCNIPEDNILKGVFSCQDSQDQTTYRSTIAGTQSYNATELVEFIQDWVHSRPTMTIQWYTVKVDHTCPVHISSLDDPECGRDQKCVDECVAQCN